MTEPPRADARTDGQPDQIERSIDIDASPEQVFALVSRPGWWINQGDVEPEPRVTHEGDVATVVHDQFGMFRFRSVRSERPSFVSFQWLDRDDPTVGTSVEFQITDRATDTATAAVTLRVLESGFATLGNTPDQVVAHMLENAQGWESELDAARRFLVPDHG